MVTDPTGRKSIENSGCVHWFMVDQPSGVWSLAKCKKCNLMTAVQNSVVTNGHGKPIPRSDEEKRAFLDSKNINIWDLVPADRPLMVLPYVKEYGIQETAHILNIPRSTIGKWAKGQSCFGRNKDAYPKNFQSQLVAKAIEENNIKKVAKEAGIPRSTLQRWMRRDELQAFMRNNNSEND